MRQNPAFKALSQLEKKKIIVAESHADSNGNNYFLIQFPQDKISLKLAGQVYDANQQAHLSVYENFNSKVPVLSAFHVTWYGICGRPAIKNAVVQKENKQDAGGNLLIDVKDKAVALQGQSVVVHIYLDQASRIVLCLAKDRRSGEAIVLSSPEEARLRCYAQEVAAGLLGQMQNCVSDNYKKAFVEVEALFNRLSQLSQHLKTQWKKYQTIAESCLEMMNEKDKWTYGGKDPRAGLLVNLLSILKMQFIEPQETELKRGPQLYQPVIESQPVEKKSEEVIKEGVSLAEASTTITKKEQETKELITSLNELDRQLMMCRQSNSDSEVDKALKENSLLAQQYELIARSMSVVSVERTLVVFQSSYQNHLAMKALFRKKALEGDIDAVRKLRQFVNSIDSLFFVELIEVGNLAVCDFVIQNFDECLFYINHLTCGSSQSNIMKYGMNLLRIAYLKHRNFNFIKMLLENGADPNFNIGTEANSISILVIILNDNLLSIEARRDFIELFLRYGANPNPCYTGQRGLVASVRHKHFQQDVSKLKSNLLKRKENFTLNVSTSETPLYIAITTLASETLVALLLQYGASFNERILGFDAIGMATCSDNQCIPELTVVKRLVDGGADINAKQGEYPNSTTPLLFACQRTPEDLTTVKGLVEMGADPNHITMSRMAVNQINQHIGMTPFLKAVFKQHKNIVQYFLEQTHCPLTLVTITKACATFFSSPNNNAVLNFVSSREGIAVLLIEEKSDVDSIQSILGSVISKVVSGGFESSEIKTTILKAVEEGKQYFLNKDYYLALISYFVPLLFGNDDQRLSACYNLGSCYRQIGQFDFAKKMYALCVNYQPDSNIGKNARKQLDKLEQSYTSSRSMKV